MVGQVGASAPAGRHPPLPLDGRERDAPPLGRLLVPVERQDARPDQRGGGGARQDADAGRGPAGGGDAQLPAHRLPGERAKLHDSGLGDRHRYLGGRRGHRRGERRLHHQGRAHSPGEQMPGGALRRPLASLQGEVFQVRLHGRARRGPVCDRVRPRLAAELGPRPPVGLHPDVHPPRGRVPRAHGGLAGLRGADPPARGGAGASHNAGRTRVA
mmetsp:Transcript_43363/g.122673  ORF Transcript_43363/g.122673 Transcript_43363/m.122673 type:complete len:214 (+) Transcript_43363:300-941(+)